MTLGVLNSCSFIHCHKITVSATHDLEFVLSEGQFIFEMLFLFTDLKNNVTLSKWLNLSLPWFSHLKNDIATYFIGLLLGLSKLILINIY